MKLLLFSIWLAVPLAVAAYHFGPGQDLLKNDAAAAHVAAAVEAVAAEDHAAAIKAYDAALAELPSGAVAESRQLRLARAKERLLGGQLPIAHDELEALFAELAKDAGAGPVLKRETQTALGMAKYYLTWLMRLEGGTEEQWKPEIEASRQHFRHLAEEAQGSGQTAILAVQRGNLESAIKLARMDLTELQGLPLPKQCQGCNSGRCNSKGRGPAKQTPPQDSRAAGKGPQPDGSGS
ncbi:MAG TPA: hypothetical protein VMN36_06550 [Verrucomicrobiales bacterium]|nr:hypothetical protein [Verrucomicrobiales bacterium]